MVKQQIGFRGFLSKSHMKPGSRGCVLAFRQWVLPQQGHPQVVVGRLRVIQAQCPAADIGEGGFGIRAEGVQADVVLHQQGTRPKKTGEESHPDGLSHSGVIHSNEDGGEQEGLHAMRDGHFGILVYVYCCHGLAADNTLLGFGKSTAEVIDHKGREGSCEQGKDGPTARKVKIAGNLQQHVWSSSRPGTRA